MGKMASLVVGILYPPEWYLSDEGFAAEVSAIEAVDPAVEVAVHTYVDSHEARTARGAGAPAGGDIESQAIAAEDRAAMRRMDVALAIDLPADIATIAPDLRWVQAVGSGTTQLQACGLEDAGITLTSNGGSNAVGIAEFAFGRLIEARKLFPEIAQLADQHLWKPTYGEQLSGQTIGLIGYGSINQAVATRAAAFGMTVLVARRTPGVPPEPPVERFYGPDELHDMLGLCSAVIAAVPETADAEAMMDEAAFAAMEHGAFFANVGRGALVDETALIAALQSGQVGAAALDVARVEPLPPDDPLWDAPNLAISGHCSTVPTAMLPNVHRLFRENLRRFLDGEPLEAEVSNSRGY
jgi:phosphoglycerate dehydrogenase-like enzyme